MGQVNINVTARMKMAAEKARIIGKKIKRPSMLELAALEWKKEKEEQDDRLKIDNEEGPSPIFSSQTSISKALLIDKNQGMLNSPADGVDWKSPSSLTGEKEGKSGWINSSSIWRHARAIMAREWSRALGRRRIDPMVSALEKEVDFWKKGKK